MVFPRETKINDSFSAKPNEPVEIELLNEGSLARWILRGGVVVEPKKVETVVEEKPNKKFKKKFEKESVEQVEEKPEE